MTMTRLPLSHVEQLFYHASKSIPIIVAMRWHGGVVAYPYPVLITYTVNKPNYSEAEPILDGRTKTGMGNGRSEEMRKIK